MSLRTIGLATVLSLLAAGGVLANTQPVVSNVVAAPVAHTGLVDITYDLADLDGDPVFITLVYSINGGLSFDGECLNVSGHAGAGVIPGAQRTARWDAGVDIGYIESTQLVVRVYADDGGGSIPAGFRRLEAGTFTMGSPAGELGRQSDEVQHEVQLTHDFDIQETEVTNQQFLELVQWAKDQGYVTATAASVMDNMGSNRELLDLDDNDCAIDYNAATGQFSTTAPTLPVKEATWYGAAAYCDWLSLHEGRTAAYDHVTWSCNEGAPYDAQGYRLPTEAEWEYACRAGSTAAFCNGAITSTNCSPMDPNLAAVGWFSCNAGSAVHAGASKAANTFGLYDMHGNMWEFCNDWYGAYGTGTVVDPVGASSGTIRIRRGGSWVDGSAYCRSAARIGGEPPANSGHNIGFRVVKSVN
ncbi:MAG: formylglycine-generating enzyme family protein [Deltaproteobacteria bacterium]|nr:formylglycine-generating enzyme family protein [Deltaproteobacteria bacterium]